MDCPLFSLQSHCKKNRISAKSCGGFDCIFKSEEERCESCWEYVLKNPAISAKSEHSCTKLRCGHLRCDLLTEEADEDVCEECEHISFISRQKEAAVKQKQKADEAKKETLEAKGLLGACFLFDSTVLVLQRGMLVAENTRVRRLPRAKRLHALIAKSNWSRDDLFGGPAYKLAMKLSFGNKKQPSSGNMPAALFNKACFNSSLSEASSWKPGDTMKQGDFWYEVFNNVDTSKHKNAKNGPMGSRGAWPYLHAASLGASTCQKCQIGAEVLSPTFTQKVSGRAFARG